MDMEGPIQYLALVFSLSFPILRPDAQLQFSDAVNRPKPISEELL